MRPFLILQYLYTVNPFSQQLTGPNRVPVFKGKNYTIIMLCSTKGSHLDPVCEGESKFAVFSAKRWNLRNMEDLIESVTPCYDAQVVGLYLGSNPGHLTVLSCKVRRLHNGAKSPLTPIIQYCRFRRYSLPISCLLGSIPGHDEVLF